MAKRMSKTLATEIAERTLAVVNPQNRAIALDAALRRHGFTPPTSSGRTAIRPGTISIAKPGPRRDLLGQPLQ